MNLNPLNAISHGLGLLVKGPAAAVGVVKKAADAILPDELP